MLNLPAPIGAVPSPFPPGAVAAHRDHESPPQSVHFVHWTHEARRDIAVRGMSWAEGHLEGLRLASSLAAWPGEITGRAHEVNGRPDPFAASSDAWVRDENAAEQRLAVAS